MLRNALYRTAGLALALLLTVSMTSTALAQYDSEEDMDKPDVVDTAVQADGFNTLVALVKQAGLVETLKGEGPFTIFAPVNPAFDPLQVQELTGDSDLLDRVLTYHVIQGQRITSGQISNGNTVQSVEGGDLAFTVSDGEVAVNGTPVAVADVRTENAVIHAIPSVLLRRTDAVERVTITEDFSILQSLVEDNNLAGTLSGPGPDGEDGLTIFAPPNDVFLATLDSDDSGSIEEDEIPNNIQSILEYHVLDDAQVPPSETDVPTLEGSNVTVVRNGDTVTVNPNDEDATVTVPDIDVTNGVIHAVDAVLTP